jgi:hypothetical protein
MTGDEMKQRNIDTIGEALGIQYTALFQEFASLNLVLEGIPRTVRYKRQAHRALEQACAGLLPDAPRVAIRDEHVSPRAASFPARRCWKGEACGPESRAANIRRRHQRENQVLPRLA